MRSELFKIINDIRINKGETIVDKIEDSDNLRDDLGFNSFDLAELTVKVEDKFEIDIFENGIVNTIKEVLEKLN